MCWGLLDLSLQFLIVLARLHDERRSNMDVQTDRLMRQSEVADLIGMSEAWLEQCRFKRQGINYIKVGRSVRYRMSDVNDWLQKNIQLCE